MQDLNRVIPNKSKAPLVPQPVKKKQQSSIPPADIEIKKKLPEGIEQPVEEKYVGPHSYQVQYSFTERNHKGFSFGTGKRPTFVNKDALLTDKKEGKNEVKKQAKKETQLKYSNPLDAVRPSYHASKTIMMRKTTFRKVDPRDFEPTWEELQIQNWKKEQLELKEKLKKGEKILDENKDTKV